MLKWLNTDWLTTEWLLFDILNDLLMADDCQADWFFDWLATDRLPCIWQLKVRVWARIWSLGDIFIFRGTEICTPFCWCKGVCLLRFPTKIAQPCVISWFFWFPSILIRFFLINTLFFFCIIFLIHSGFDLERKSILMFEHFFWCDIC